eukprot:11406733-Alexandrium_andersonii.AAC.1
MALPSRGTSALSLSRFARQGVAPGDPAEHHEAAQDGAHELPCADLLNKDKHAFRRKLLPRLFCLLGKIAIWRHSPIAKAEDLVQGSQEQESQPSEGGAALPHLLADAGSQKLGI